MMCTMKMSVCFCRLKELEEQYAKEKAATERQFEKQRQVNNNVEFLEVFLRVLLLPY